MCCKNRTKAYSKIKGGNIYPEIHGVVFFDEVEGGTEVSVEVWCLPLYKAAEGNNQPKKYLKYIKKDWQQHFCLVTF